MEENRALMLGLVVVCYCLTRKIKLECVCGCSSSWRRMCSLDSTCCSLVGVLKQIGFEEVDKPEAMEEAREHTGDEGIWLYRSVERSLH